MIGITSYGGYIPKLRMDRMMMFQAVAWFAPAVIAVAQGERSLCNWDEDALSMAGGRLTLYTCARPHCHTRTGRTPASSRPR